MEQKGEPAQILEPEGHTAGCHHHKRIEWRDAGPGSRQRLKALLIVKKPDAILAPVVAVLEELKAPPAPGMEGMGYLKVLWRITVARCS
jgi:hypothetical protein